MTAGNQPASLFDPFLNSDTVQLQQLAKKGVSSALIAVFKTRN